MRDLLRRPDFESLIFAYVDRGLSRDPAFVGVLVTVQGIGGLLGGLMSAAIVRRIGELAALGLGVAIFAPASLALTYPNLWLGCAAMATAGLGLPIVVVGLNTLLQRRTPAPLLGRVSAASEALISAPQALSIGIGAVLVGIVDYRLLFLLIGAGMAAVATYLWQGRRLSPPAAAVDSGAPAGESALDAAPLDAPLDAAPFDAALDAASADTKIAVPGAMVR